MKKTLLFITMMLGTALSVQAQEYKPMLEEGKMWTIQYELVLGPEYRDVYVYTDVKIEGDSIYEGKVYKKIYEREVDRNEVIPTEWTFTGQLIGEEDRKIYILRKENEEVRRELVMDFSLGVGDVLDSQPTASSTPFRVVAVTDTILANSTDKTPRKCMHVEHPNASFISDVLIEGIGSQRYGLWGVKDFVGNPGGITTLSGCCEGATSLYRTVPFTNITWKLYGFGTVGEETIRRAAVMDGTYFFEDMSTLTFYDNGTIYGFASVNKVHGKYYVHDNDIKVPIFGGEKVRGFDDGSEMWDAMYAATNYEMKDGHLLLYYNNRQNYLLFYKKEELIAGIDSPVSSPTTDAPLYDLQGRRLSAKPVKGMYIQGGRKYVVK